MSGPVSSAVVSEVVSRITSLLTGKCSEHRNVQEWVDRLVRVRIKLESVIKVSEGFDIDNKGLHEWQEKFKEDLCEAEEVLRNFQAEILHEKPNQTVGGGSSSHDQSMKEEGSNDATLVLPISKLREAVSHQVNQEANLPNDQPMQEEGSNDATLVLPISNLREAVPHQVDQEANLPNDQPMQEEGSNDATLVLPISNLREAVPHQVDQEANLPNDQPMQEEGSDEATYPMITRQVDLEANPYMQEEGSDDATSKLWADVTNLTNWAIASNKIIDLAAFNNNPFMANFSLRHKLSILINFLVIDKLQLQQSIYHIFTCRPVFRTIEPVAIIGRVLKSPKILLGEYLENDEKVSKLIKTVEKLEKSAGDIGEFTELLKLQWKRNMSRKRKRSGVALQGFLLVISLKLQTYALFCYGEDPYLLVIMLFRANCNIPTGITSEIFIGFIM